MPELPEVETIRLQLSQLVIGQTIKDIQILYKKSFIGDKKLLVGQKIIGIRRFGKILVIDLSNGLSLAVHLKMSGQLIYFQTTNNKQQITKKASEYKLHKYTRLIIEFISGDKLYFNDQRKFGWARVARNDIDNSMIQCFNFTNNIINLGQLIKNLGPEPDRDLTINKFIRILKSSKRPVKLILMDQSKIAGVGNIYANEALFLAGIDPRKKANKLSEYRVIQLYNSLLKVLKEAVIKKGASRMNFVDVFGEKGKAQEHFFVYDREGEKCLNKCGEFIKKIKLGGRGTYFCQRCQRK